MSTMRESIREHMYFEYEEVFEAFVERKGAILDGKQPYSRSTLFEMERFGWIDRATFEDGKIVWKCKDEAMLEFEQYIRERDHL